MPRPRGTHHKAFLIAAALVLTVASVMVYGIVAQILHDRDDYIGAARALMHEQSYALGEHITKNMDATAALADAVAAQVAEGAARSGDRRVGAVDLRWLQDHVKPFQGVRSIAVFDQTGAQSSGVGDRTANPQTAAGLPFFWAHRDEAMPGFTDRPALDPATGRWSIAVSRRIVGPDAAFIGAVRVVVEPVDAYRFYSQRSGTESITAVTDGDGRILASWPRADTQGVDLAGRTAQAVPLLGALSSDALAGVGQRSLDAGGRLVVINRLTGLPLAVVVGQSYDDILAPWREEALEDSLPAVFAVLLSIALLAAFGHYARRRDEAEAALRHSRAEAEYDRAQLETLYRTAPVGLMLIDRELRYVHINDRMAEIRGAPASTFIGRTVREMVPPHVADLVEPIYREVVSTGQPRLNLEVSETAEAPPHATQHWICSYYPVHGADGAVAGINAVIQDVTELKRAEAKLERREEQFRALIENASDLISVIDATGKITFHSPSSQALGYRPDELVGRNYEEFVHPDDVEACRKAIADVAIDIGGIGSVEFRMRHKDGGWRVLDAVGRNAMHRRAIRGIVINARDVTAIRQAEATRARLAAALDAASEGFALFDVHDRLVYVNSEFGRVTGLGDVLKPAMQYEDVMRASIERGYIVDAVGNEAAWLREHMTTRRYSATPRDYFRPKDGSWLRVRTNTLPNAGTLFVYTDITEEKQRAEDLRQAQKLEVVGKLTAGVAHDFNNLLTAVIGNLELLSGVLAEDTRLAPLVGTAMTAAERGAKLVQQLLSFARKQPLDALPRNLGEVVGGMADLLRTTLGGKIILDISIGDELWPCKIDAQQLEHALLNLATNARDAMPDGGSVTIDAVNLRAAVPFPSLQGNLAPGDYVVLTVADTGTGMPADVVARAIEPFFTTKDVGKGSGLGLSMVYGFAKQSGGDMVIDSAPGEGTRIELYLPRADTARETTEVDNAAA